MKFLYAAAAVLSLAACGGSLEPLAMNISVTANKTTAAVGDTVAFVATAQGDNLTGVAVTYGDGGADSFDLFAARTAKVTFKHVYTTAGNYTATTTVTDVTEAHRDATIGVQIH